MSRRTSRVAPLPDPFVLDDAVAAQSPLHRRLVFVALPEGDDAARLVGTLESTPGVRVLRGLGLFHDRLGRMWEAFQQPSDVGLAQLATGEQFLAALRVLADELIGPASAGAEVLVDWSPAHGEQLPLAAIRSIYPDALVVTDPRAAADDVLAAVGAGQAPPPEWAPAPVGRELDERLIVVVGCGRSGTTWLEELLMAHPRVSGAPRTESWLFHQLEPLWRLFEEEGSPLATTIQRPLFVAALRRFADAMFVAARDHHRPDADFVVEKTPVHWTLLPQISALYPDAWFLHLIRDGRDVARSIAQVPFFQIPDETRAAALWRDVVTRIRADSRTCSRYRELRYEDLVAAPVAHLRQVFDWIGLDLPAAAEHALVEAAAQRVSAHAGTAAPVGPGTWRSLPSGTLAGIYREAGDLLVAERYASRLDVWRGRLRVPARS